MRGHCAQQATKRLLLRIIQASQQMHLGPAESRSAINELTVKQNEWTLGAYCQSYCRFVGMHHTLEDRALFPDLRRADIRLAPVVARLSDEHEAIAGILTKIDSALVAMVRDPAAIAEVRAAVDLLTDALLSHLSVRRSACHRSVRIAGRPRNSGIGGPHDELAVYQWISIRALAGLKPGWSANADCGRRLVRPVWQRAGHPRQRMAASQPQRWHCDGGAGSGYPGRHPGTRPEMAGRRRHPVLVTHPA
jgi:hypothetical protein